MPIVISGTNGISGVDGTASNPSYEGTDSNTGIFFPAADTIAFAEGGTEVARFDSSGNLGIGTSSPDEKLTVTSTNPTGGLIASLRNNGTSSLTGSKLWFNQNTVDNWNIGQPAGVNAFVFCNSTGSTNERMRIDSSGNVGIGTSSPVEKLDVRGNAQFRQADGSYIKLTSTSTVADIEFSNTPALRFVYNGTTERARIDSSGNLLVGKTATGYGTAGVQLEATGSAGFTRSSEVPVVVNRLTNDGILVSLRQDTTEEGSISVSGTTVSYNAFAGSHWSQLQDGSKPEILRGTVMESIDELVQWPDEPTSERLCRSKISNTAGSKRVYGVFMCWDEDWTSTNDMLVTSLGAFVCRVNAGVTVQMGDLLESNGDGTARVQADDIIRSSTIGKVTSTVKTHEYDDGSYCVPTVLYCG